VHLSSMNAGCRSVARPRITCAAGLFAASLLSVPAAAQTHELATTNGIVLAKALGDECWVDLGENEIFDFPPCEPGKQEKVSQSYVWSLVNTEEDVWFGTVANAECTTSGLLSATDTGATPHKTPSWACEFGASPYSPPLPPEFGDFRPPRLYRFNKPTRTLHEITPTSRTTVANPTGLDSLVRATSGFRVGFRVGDHVILGGPGNAGGINFFAFRISDKAYVAKGTLVNYVNMRQVVEHNGIRYAGAARASGGSILRYTGTIPSLPVVPPGAEPAPCASCFRFQPVGIIESDAANITVHNDRLYVSAWPNGPDPRIASLFMSPVIPSGGLTLANANQWVKIWQADYYEPDPILVQGYAGGAIASFNGWVYWGTTHVPYSGLQKWVEVYGPPETDQELERLLVYTWRTISIWRGKDFDTASPTIELLYGAPQLFKYTPGGDAGVWALTENNIPGNKSPKYGQSGFGNTFNVYTWSMATWSDRLWIGTFDWGYIADQSQYLETLPEPTGGPVVPSARAGVPQISGTTAPRAFGGDLWTFGFVDGPAKAEDTGGLGNYTSYGVRSLAPGGGSLFVGMANAMNLLTNPADDVPEGGWELIELVPKP
jgi:hypothetical protein